MLTPRDAVFNWQKMDKLQDIIESRRAEIAENERKLFLLKAELAAYEEAARLRPVATENSNQAIAVKSGGLNLSGGRGRPSGAILPHWSKTITEMTLDENKKFSYDEIYELAKTHGFTGSLSSARDRVRSYVESDYLAGDHSKGFSVTPLGRTKVQ